ncbi:MAG: hypothetical protein KDD14_07165 [Saprospiraceae bacterium]|nr:hypothetical protein [Saprospiraceae bacterium]
MKHPEFLCKTDLEEVRLKIQTRASFVAEVAAINPKTQLPVSRLPYD